MGTYVRNRTGRRELRGVESNHGFQDQNLAGCLATPPRIKKRRIYLKTR